MQKVSKYRLGAFVCESNKLMGNSMFAYITKAHIERDSRVPTTDSDTLQLISFSVKWCKALCRKKIKGYPNDPPTASLKLHHLLC